MMSIYGFPFKALVLGIMGLVSAGCTLPGEADPPEGACTGQVGGVDMHQSIDRDSEFFVVWARTCGAQDRTLFNICYGDGLLDIHAEKKGLVSIIGGEQSYDIPPSSSTAIVDVWDISHPLDAPLLLEGEFRIKREVSSLLDGGHPWVMEHRLYHWIALFGANVMGNSASDGIKS